MNFEPRITSEPKWMVLPLTLIIGMLVIIAFLITQINKTIQQIPKETVKFIHTEFNP